MFLRFLSLSSVHVMQFVECNALYATSRSSFIYPTDKIECRYVVGSIGDDFAFSSSLDILFFIE